MKKLIIYFIVLLAAIWLGLIMHDYAGFVMINFGHTRIETTVWAAILALLILFVGLRLLIGLIRGIFHMPRRYAYWSAAKGERIAYRHMQAGVFSLLESNYLQAEKYFLKSTKSEKIELLNYLGAANAAHFQQNFKQRDKYLAKARKMAIGEYIQAVDMIKARWQMESDEWSSALLTLKSLPPHHPLVLEIRKQVYIAQKNWDALKSMLLEIKQSRLFKNKTIDRLKYEIVLSLMQQGLSIRNHIAMEKLWGTLSKDMKTDPEILAIYAAHLIDEGKHDEAEVLLKHALKNGLHLPLPLLNEYIRVESPKPPKHLLRAESWLTSNPENAGLLFYLGKLCQRYQLWGKAKKYFQSSIKVKPTKQAYQALGEVLEQLDENIAALACYREGLLCLSDLKELDRCQ
jgi:HemY protein